MPEELIRMETLKLQECDLIQTNKSTLFGNEPKPKETLSIDTSKDESRVDKRSVLEETPCIDISTGENMFKTQTILGLARNSGSAQITVKESHENSSVSSSKQETILIEGNRLDSKLLPCADVVVAAIDPITHVLVRRPRKRSFVDFSKDENVVDERSSQEFVATRRPYTDADVQLLLKVYEDHGGDWKAISKYFPDRTTQSVGRVPKLLFVMMCKNASKLSLFVLPLIYSSSYKKKCTKFKEYKMEDRT